MVNERIDSIADTYWASYFGCSPGEIISGPMRILTHGKELEDYCGAFAIFRGTSATVSLPPDHADELRRLLSGLSHGCSPSEFALALGSVSTAVVGPAYIGYTTTVPEPGHPVRTLGPGDAAALLTLRESCDATEWEHGGGDAGHPSSGVFVGGQLAAVASYEVWGGTIAHISIITHPDFRSRGFGRSAVAHLAGRAVRAGLLPQYRTLESNLASIRIAESLGFGLYATSMAVRLNYDASPSR